MMTLTLAMVALASFSDAAADEAKKMDGKWRSKSAIMAGQAMPEEVVKSIVLKLEGGKYTATVGDQKDEGTMKVDPSKKPKTMDIVGVEGPNKGKTFLCIYEQDGDKLKVCYDLSGKQRPKKFESKEKTLLFLVEYVREKK